MTQVVTSLTYQRPTETEMARTSCFERPRGGFWQVWGVPRQGLAVEMSVEMINLPSMGFCISARGRITY